jgi:hypothetical protein
MKLPLIHWLIFTLAVIGFHLYLIKIKKQSPDKRFWFLLRIGVAALLLFVEKMNGTRPIEVSILCYFFSAWFFHDTFIALGLRERPWYLNNTGPIDKLLQGYAYPVWVLKAIAALTLIAMYFFNAPV